MTLRNIFWLVKEDYFGKAFGCLSVSQAVAAVTNFLLISFYTKNLPPQEFGKISIIWLLVTFLGIAVDSRLNTSICIRYYKSPTEETISNIYTTLFYYLVVSIVLCLILISNNYIIVKLINTTINQHEIYIIVAIILSMTISNLLSSILIVSKKSVMYVGYILSMNAVLVATSLYFVLILKLGYISYLYSYLAAYFSVAVLALLYLHRNFRYSRGGGLSLVKLKSLLRIGFPLIPDAILLLLFSGAGRYILNAYSGFALVGIFSAGFTFSNIFNTLLIAPLGQAVFPILCEKYVKSRDEFRSLLAGIVKYYWIGVTIAIIMYFFFLKEFFNLFVGHGYSKGYDVAGIMLFGVAFSGVSNLLSVIVVMKEKTSKIFIVTSVAFAANLIINVTMVPRYGIYGASIALTSGYIVQAVFMTYYTQKLELICYDYKNIAINILLFTIYFIVIYFLSESDMASYKKTLTKLIVALMYVYHLSKIFMLKDAIINILSRRSYISGLIP
jgi:O-antigen/teichoic acid export membrane protein